MSYKDLSVDFVTPLAGDNNRVKLEQYLQLLDDYRLRNIEAVKANFPDYAPLDALPYLENEMQLPRFLGESDVSLRAKLKGAWDRWPFAGSARGVLKAIKEQNYSNTNVRLIQVNGLIWEIAADPSDVVTPTAYTPHSVFLPTGLDPNFYTYFSIFFFNTPPGPNWRTAKQVPFTSGGATFVDVTWDSPFETTDYRLAYAVVSSSAFVDVSFSNVTRNGLRVSIDATATVSVHVIAWQQGDWFNASMTPSEKNKMCSLIKRWKSGKSLFFNFIIRIRGHVWGEPGLEWGDPGLVWGGSESVKVSC